MRKKMAVFCVGLCCGAILAGGCAKKEIVKGEEQAPSVAKPAETARPKPAPKEEMVKEQPVQEAAVAKETPAMTSAEAAAEAALGKVYFDFDSFVLSQAARDTLSGNAEYLLKKNRSVKVQIEGHCDERGSDEYNLALGEKRAKAAFELHGNAGSAGRKACLHQLRQRETGRPGTRRGCLVEKPAG